MEEQHITEEQDGVWFRIELCDPDARRQTPVEVWDLPTLEEALTSACAHMLQDEQRKVAYISRLVTPDEAPMAGALLFKITSF